MTDKFIANMRPPADCDAELGRLAACVNEAHRQVAESLSQAVSRSLAAGRSLLAAKQICGKGKFSAWLKSNFEFSSSTARGYMRFVAKWNELGLDLQRAGGLSQRQITRLLKGLPCSDGRANPRRAAALPAPVEPACLPVAADTELSRRPPAAGPLGCVSGLLRQVVVELRRQIDADGPDARYARHVLLPLEHILECIPRYRWFWDLTRAIES